MDKVRVVAIVVPLILPVSNLHILTYSKKHFREDYSRNTSSHPIAALSRWSLMPENHVRLIPFQQNMSQKYPLIHTYHYH